MKDMGMSRGKECADNNCCILRIGENRESLVDGNFTDEYANLGSSE
tara:strand:+ start:749 stop:886 length:138 start_codon:yes stop_codon:yes gene_type:complete